MLVIDTDVLIDFLKGVPASVHYLSSLSDPPFISSLTVAELYAGVRDNERSALDSLTTHLQTVFVDRDIAVRGGLIRRDYRSSHGVGLVDALIAATVEAHNATLVTLNRRHFPTLSNVVVPYQKP
ncbi:MAG: type II toxin-antitoxin system VapC family toxin [Planctomycetaceae bacterium]